MDQGTDAPPKSIARKPVGSGSTRSLPRKSTPHTSSRSSQPEDSSSAPRPDNSTSTPPPNADSTFPPHFSTPDDDDDGGVADFLASLPPQIADRVRHEHPLFLEVRALAHRSSLARVENLCILLEKSPFHCGDAYEAKALMDWVQLLRDIKTYSPGFGFPVDKDELRIAHYFTASVIKTSLLDPNVKTYAQMLALEPPQGSPIHRSYFISVHIPFAFDAQRYQQDCDYRHWIGERALEMTETTSLDEWKQELDQRYHNRPRMGMPVDPNPNSRFPDDYDAYVFHSAMERTNRIFKAMVQARNASLKPQSSGWAKHPGIVGPPLSAGVTALPKLPEMHSGTAGESPPDHMVYTSQVLRFPMSRNWTTLEELFLFPLSLRPVSPAEFGQRPVNELLFTDRFGVTMLGVSQTVQCNSIAEHDIFTNSIAKLNGYDQTLACHGITYEEYRNMIIGLLDIIYRSLEGDTGRTNPILTGKKIKKFFERVTEELRARGTPVVIKYKVEEKFHMSQLSIRHHPIGLPIRGKLGNRLNPKG